MKFDDWEYRLRQPTYFGGPINLRPFLDKNWLRHGGDAEVIVALSKLFASLSFQHLLNFATGFMTVQLPPIPRLPEDYEGQDVPEFEDFMSFGRFLHRARLVKEVRQLFPSQSRHSI
jgi:hypothetical protein